MNDELILYPPNIQLDETFLISCSAGGRGRINFFHIQNDHIFIKTLFQTLFTLSVNANSYEKVL